MDGNFSHCSFCGGKHGIETCPDIATLKIRVQGLEFAIAEFGKLMDKIMASPKSYERGQRIAQAVIDLENVGKGKE